jgi:hypothetical protein
VYGVRFGLKAEVSVRSPWSLGYRGTVRKMLRYAVPPGYQRQQPVQRLKLGSWLGAMDAILEEDKRRPAKQRHTAKRIFERLRTEYAFSGGYTILKDYMRSFDAVRHLLLCRIERRPPRLGLAMENYPHLPLAQVGEVMNSSMQSAARS